MDSNEIMAITTAETITALTAQTTAAEALREKLRHNSIGPAIAELRNMFNALNDRFFDGKFENVVETIQTKGRMECTGWYSTGRIWHNDEGR